MDVSTRAWKVGYEEAAPKALRTLVDGVEIPYLDLESLIASKETYRDKDHLDIAALRPIQAERLRSESGNAPGPAGSKWLC